MVILSLIISTCAYKCESSQDINGRRVKDITYKFDFTDKYVTKNMGQGPASGDLYFAADVSVGLVDDQYYYFARLKDTLEAVWQRIYAYRGSAGMFDIDHKENFIYSAVAELSLTLMQYDASNGNITKIKYCKGLRDQMLSKIVVSPDDTTIFTSAQKKTTFYGEICRWVVSNDDSMTCRELSGYDIPYMLIPLDNSKLFITIQDYQVLYNASTYNVLTNFDGNQDLWSMKISCTKEFRTMGKSMGIYDQPKSILYNIWNFRYDEMFFTLNANNGKFINSKFIWSDYENCYQVLTMQRNDNIIYFSFSCRVYMAIASYDILQDKFTSSYSGDYSLSKHVFLKNKIFFSYSIEESYPSCGYFKIGPIDGVNSLFNFILSNHTMVIANNEKDYYFSSNKTLTFTTEVWPITPYQDPIVEKKDYILTKNFDSYSDTVFFLEPLYAGKYINNHIYEIPLNLTCSISGNTTFRFQNEILGSNNSSWLFIHNETTMTINAPKVKTETNYIFYVNASTSDRHQDRQFSRLVQITLLPCAKSNCEDCSQKVDSCVKCVEGFKVDGEECIQAYSTDYAYRSGYIVQGFLYVFLAAILFFRANGKVEMNLFWSVLHQYQMILLLPTLGNTIVTDIVNMLLRSDFLWLSFSFIDFSKAFNINIPDDCEIEIDYSSQSRINYDCFILNSIQNGFPLIIFLTIVCIIVILMKILRSK